MAQLRLRRRRRLSMARAARGAAYPSFTLDLNAIRIAHASLAIAAMLVFFPFGGVIIRLVDPDEHRHIVWCE